MLRTEKCPFYNPPQAKSPAAQNKKNLRAAVEKTTDPEVFHYGIYPVEGIGVFRVPKNGDARNKKPPALRVETKRCTKKSPFRYNRVVQALL